MQQLQLFIYLLGLQIPFYFFVLKAAHCADLQFLLLYLPLFSFLHLLYVLTLLLTYVLNGNARLWNSNIKSGIKGKGNSINQLITALNSLCAENNIHIYSESLHSLPDNKTDGSILCIIQLVFYILLDYAIKAGRQPLRLLFFIKQEENDFVIISVSLIGSAISRRRNKTASLQCSLHEILLNHLVRICHGRVQYLDNQASAKNIRIIVPVSNILIPARKILRRYLSLQIILSE